MNDFVLGILFALPIYALILLLIRDIVIKHFIKCAIVQKTSVEVPEDALTKSVLDDILISYRLLLVLKIEFSFLVSHKYLINDKDTDVLSSKLLDINEAILSTENMLEEKGIQEYKEIKREVFSHNSKMGDTI